MNGKLTQECRVEHVHTGPAQRVATIVADDAGCWKSKGVGQSGGLRRTSLILRGVEPAVRPAHGNGCANAIYGCGGCAVRIEQVGEPTSVHGEGTTAIVGVNTGGAEATENVAQQTLVRKAFAPSDGQLVDVVERDTVGDVEVASSLPGDVVTAFWRRSGAVLEFLRCVVEALRERVGGA